LVPHALQLLTSVCKLTQLPLQPVIPAAQHTPLLQVWPLPQTLPQVPQLFPSVWRLTSQPLLCLLPSQSPKPGLQVPLHTPPLQLGVMLLAEQASVHEPQWLTSFPLTLMQAVPPQSVCPPGHDPPQTPLEHVGDPPEGVGHTLPQRPQLLTSPAMLVSQPLGCLSPVQLS
jgi:hypothetical protein